MAIANADGDWAEVKASGLRGLGFRVSGRNVEDGIVRSKFPLI